MSGMVFGTGFLTSLDFGLEPSEKLMVLIDLGLYLSRIFTIIAFLLTLPQNEPGKAGEGDRLFGSYPIPGIYLPNLEAEENPIDPYQLLIWNGLNRNNIFG